MGHRFTRKPPRTDIQNQDRSTDEGKARRVQVSRVEKLIRHQGQLSFLKKKKLQTRRNHEPLRMEQAYGAGKAGGTFDPITFFQQPQIILRIVSWIFSIVIFGCIANEGYVNRPDEVEEFCIFNRNQNACNYAVGMGSLAFLCCAAFMALDVYFPQISSVKDRKKAVLADIGVSAFWSFVWFVGFCFLANQWQVAKPEDNPLKEGGDAARAAITFAFFSIFTWGVLTLLALERLKKVSFEEEYDKLFTPHTPAPFV